MPIQQLGMFFLAAAAVGGVAWVFLYPLLSGDRNAEKRMQSVAKPDRSPAKIGARATPKLRRDNQIEDTLKQLEVRRKKQKSPPLEVRIEQAGLTWSKQHFIIGSGVLGAVAFIGVLAAGGDLLPAAGVAFGASLGLPRWVLMFIRKRRHTRFLENFPDAVDIIVRGIKAGLPLLDSSRASSEPSSRHRPSAFRSGRRAEDSTSGSRCRKRISSASSSRSSRRPAAICRKRSETCRACCAIARR
jgi:tight adherence protein B